MTTIQEYINTMSAINDVNDYLKVTPLSVAIHRQSENPVYGKDGSSGAGILHVSIDDDGGGPFLVIKQLEDDPMPGVVRMNPEELPFLLQAAQHLGVITEASTWLLEVAKEEDPHP
jgi:hypothetical protein